MFGSVLTAITGPLDRRYLLNAFFPALIFAGLLLVVGVAAQRDLATAAAQWTAQEMTFKTLQVVAFLGVVTFLSAVLAGLPNVLVSLYEGYWRFPGGQRLAAVGRRWHQARLQDLEDSDSGQAIIASDYPDDPNAVMPTRLGNIIKNAESYPHGRYHIDSVLIWPRLYPLLPDGFLSIYTAARAALDFMVVVSTLSGAFALLSGGYLLSIGAAGGVDWWLFPLCFGGGFLLAWLAYLGALTGARPYGQQVKVAFDLYRHDLLAQMHLPMPADPGEEKERWDEVTGFFLFAVPGASWHFTDATPAAAPPNPAPAPPPPAPADPPRAAAPPARHNRRAAWISLRPISFWLWLPVLVLLVAGTTTILVRDATDTVTIAVPAYDLPAYHRITARDLTLHIVDARSVGADAMRDQRALIGRYTLTRLTASNVIPAADVGPRVSAARLRGTIPISLPSVTLLGTAQNAGPGQEANLILVPPRPTSGAPARSSTYRHLLLLSIQPVPGQSDLAHTASIVIAFPRARLPSFAGSTPGASYWLTST